MINSDTRAVTGWVFMERLAPESVSMLTLFPQ